MISVTGLWKTFGSDHKKKTEKETERRRGREGRKEEEKKTRNETEVKEMCVWSQLPRNSCRAALCT